MLVKLAYIMNIDPTTGQTIHHQSHYQHHQKPEPFPHLTHWQCDAHRLWGILYTPGDKKAPAATLIFHNSSFRPAQPRTMQGFEKRARRFLRRIISLVEVGLCRDIYEIKEIKEIKRGGVAMSIPASLKTYLQVLPTVPPTTMILDCVSDKFSVCTTTGRERKIVGGKNLLGIGWVCVCFAR